ncbi:MAG: hypothetical protein M0R33_15570 [Methylomonas sp.]|jgi:hypothetical protein|uniref:hypothetical protein n=1 Tax=Methylomonas sp. TaxID=418 RepID=UPI0025F02EBD|nr:hypothetical protein [Methylomonas sp.]MCK9607862.1 hypothetical protein [Methylomonas sp.]
MNIPAFFGGAIDTISRINVASKIFDNPIYVALLITIVIITILYFTLQPKDSRNNGGEWVIGDSRYSPRLLGLRAFIYSFISCVAIFFLYHRYQMKKSDSSSLSSMESQLFTGGNATSRSTAPADIIVPVEIRQSPNLVI